MYSHINVQTTCDDENARINVVEHFLTVVCMEGMFEPTRYSAGDFMIALALDMNLQPEMA